MERLIADVFGPTLRRVGSFVSGAAAAKLTSMGATVETQQMVIGGAVVAGGLGLDLALSRFWRKRRGIR